MLYTYQYGSQSHTIRMERAPDGTYTADIDGRHVNLSVKLLHEGGWLLTVDGERFTVYGSAQGQNRLIHVAGEQYVLTVPDTSAKRRRGAAGGGDLTAQMPGQIVDVLVAEGDDIQSGQTLVILEAMKMEIRVTAPTDGRVRRLPVAKGAVVERGQVLVEMETHP